MIASAFFLYGYLSLLLGTRRPIAAQRCLDSLHQRHVAM
jgi:hypothetical protein